MEKLIIAQKQPFVMTVEPGTYYWCACGGSKNQPFCDGSHKGTRLFTKAGGNNRSKENGLVWL